MGEDLLKNSAGDCGDNKQEGQESIKDTSKTKQSHFGESIMILFYMVVLLPIQVLKCFEQFIP